MLHDRCISHSHLPDILTREITKFHNVASWLLPKNYSMSKLLVLYIACIYLHSQLQTFIDVDHRAIQMQLQYCIIYVRSSSHQLAIAIQLCHSDIQTCMIIMQTKLVTLNPNTIGFAIVSLHSYPPNQYHHLCDHMHIAYNHRWT